MGDWRDNKDEEIKLDGIGGVTILVKADVHRSGQAHARKSIVNKILTCPRYQFPLLCLRKSSRDGRICQDG
jgi:hypothetical protein